MNIHQKLLLSSNIVQHDALVIEIRAFVPPVETKKGARKSRKSNSSEYTLIFDIETTTDAAQQMRFGVFQLFKCDAVIESGIFVDTETMTEAEREMLRRYSASHGLEIMSSADFIENIFYGKGYELRATIVGFNLPFDLSRLAWRHGSARGKTMRGGFTLQLVADRLRPRIQVKHLSARAALIQFTKPKRRNDSRGMRNRGIKVTTRRGAFIDVKTLAATLTSRSFTLKTLADFLETEHRKLSTDKHGGPLTEEYIEYAAQDVRVTWECYRTLLRKFEAFALSQTRPSQLMSEASLGKGCLKEMGICPWREVQPDFPDRLVGIIMSAYYGGRSEVRLRRVVTQVLYCDFQSMYPTVCTLMGLWRLVIAKGVKWHDSTADVVSLLDRIGLLELQSTDIWRGLKTLVQVLPNEDVFPVRAKYVNEAQATIGLNYLSSTKPLWFTLADCIAAKLLTGKSVKVLNAITFEEAEPQDGLKTINIAGNDKYAIDPTHDDFYRRLIDLRNELKVKLKAAGGADADTLESEQLALKILANATSYGIFVELNVEELEARQQRLCHGPSGEAFEISTLKGEEPGRYFHPIIATLITGAARLMLAIAETLSVNAGIDWAFCDTDSMALAKPEGMDQEAFISAAQSVRDWFTPLNPYETKGPIFKIEDANYGIRNRILTNKLKPLFCLAISSKRYVLFNLDPAGNPVIRKASAHGLGHLLAPYPDSEAPAHTSAPSTKLFNIGVERWQYDLWYQIIRAALERHPDCVDLDYHLALGRPAASRYGSTTPRMLGWFKRYNQPRCYRDQVKPFNFLLVFQASPASIIREEILIELPARRRTKNLIPKPIAAYDSNIVKGAGNCFDRDTGKQIHPDRLKTYREALASYHLSPESKFLNGDYLDQGATRRRHIQVTGINHIGKEANHWEAQYYLGFDPREKIEYGVSRDATLISNLREVARQFGQRVLAAKIGISRSALASLIAAANQNIPPRLISAINWAISELNCEAETAEMRKSQLFEMAKLEIKQIGLGGLAAVIGTDPSNLAKVLSGRRKPTGKLIDRLSDYFSEP